MIVQPRPRLHGTQRSATTCKIFLQMVLVAQRTEILCDWLVSSQTTGAGAGALPRSLQSTCRVSAVDSGSQRLGRGIGFVMLNGGAL